MASKKRDWSKRPAPPVRDPSMVQLGLWIDGELRQQFKLATIVHGVTMTDVVSDAIHAWLAKHPAPEMPPGAAKSAD